MSNFHGKYVSAVEHFGGKGIDVNVKSKEKSVQISISIDENDEIIVHRHTSDHKHK